MTYLIPFSFSVTVGESELPQCIEGEIPALLRDDPKEDECDVWHWSHPGPGKLFDYLPHDVTRQMEAMAIEQARKQQAADEGERKIAAYQDERTSEHI